MLNITIVTKDNRYRFTAAELRGYIASRGGNRKCRNRSVRWRITLGHAAIVPWSGVRFEIANDGKTVCDAILPDCWGSPLGLAKQMLDALGEMQNRDLTEVRLIVPSAEDEKEQRELACYRTLLEQMLFNLSYADEFGHEHLARVYSRVSLIKVGRKWYGMADGSYFRGSDVYDLFKMLDKNVRGRIVAGVAAGGAFETGIANIVAEYCNFGWNWGPDPAGFREVAVDHMLAPAHVKWINSIDTDIGFKRAVPWWDE